MDLYPKYLKNSHHSIVRQTWLFLKHTEDGRRQVGPRRDALHRSTSGEGEAKLRGEVSAAGLAGAHGERPGFSSVAGDRVGWSSRSRKWLGVSYRSKHGSPQGPAFSLRVLTQGR